MDSEHQGLPAKVRVVLRTAGKGGLYPRHGKRLIIGALTPEARWFQGLNPWRCRRPRGRTALPKCPVMTAASVIEQPPPPTAHSLNPIFDGVPDLQPRLFRHLEEKFGDLGIELSSLLAIDLGANL